MTSDLLDIINRDPAPQPWSEGDKIPWNEPGFSSRMLREHLTQDHDAASRRTGTIERHVAFIHDVLLKGQPGRVLDLGCGPGLYSNRLARLGHRCVGIDFSPASIAYAREQAQAEHLECTFVEADLRTATFDPGADVALLLFGECNVFRPEALRDILTKACQALRPGGVLLLEPSTADAVERIGHTPATWSAHEAALFSAKPHLLLHESFWEPTERVATDRWFVIDAATGQVERHAASQRAYTLGEILGLLMSVGFARVEPVADWDAGASFADSFFAVVAQR